MAGKQIITVFGATGNQGGSVVNAVLASPALKDSWSVRGVTRNTTSDRAKALQAKGVETVTADMNDPASLEKALAGSTAVYAMTDFWEKMDKDLEIAQGKNVADAAKAVGVKHLIFSAIPNVSKISKGKLVNVKHFDSKAEVEEYIRAQGIPATFFEAGPYMSSMCQNMKGQSKDGTVNLALPFKENDTMPLFDVRDTGAYVAGIIEKGESYFGKNVPAATGFYTGPEIISEVAKVSGKQANFISVTDEQFESALPPTIAKEFGEMFYFMRDYGYFGRPGAKEEVDQVAKDLGVKRTSWEQSLKDEGVADW